MRVSHSQLKDIRSDPEGAAAAMTRPGGGIRRGGFDQAVRDAIFVYHQATPADETGAHQYLIGRLQRFKNRSRTQRALDDFRSYVAWSRANQVVVADTRINVELWLSDEDVISGQVSRLDITEEGYRAVLLGRPQDDWRAELRMPLLQQAVANQFDRPVELFAVGVQSLDGSGAAWTKFTPDQIAAGAKEACEALSRFRAALERARDD